MLRRKPVLKEKRWEEKRGERWEEEQMVLLT